MSVRDDRFTVDPGKLQQNFFAPIKGSLCRRVRDVVGVICEIWRSMQSYFITIESESVTNLAWDDKMVKSYVTAYNSLRNGAPLNHTTRLVYMEALQSEYRTFQYCAENSQLPEWSEGVNQLAFQIVVKGTCGRPHVLAVVVDSVTHTIEFYDPKGLTLEDRDKDSLIGSNVPLRQLVENIWEKYAVDKGWSLQENTARHQDDGYNSGVYVCNYIKRRCEGISHKDIWANGLSFPQASKDTRKAMITEINTYYHNSK